MHIINVGYQKKKPIQIRGKGTECFCTSFSQFITHQAKWQQQSPLSYNRTYRDLNSLYIYFGRSKRQAVEIGEQTPVQKGSLSRYLAQELTILLSHPHIFQCGT